MNTGEQKKAVSWTKKKYLATDLIKKALRALKLPDSPFRWNPRDGIFAYARELPPSIDVGHLLEAIEVAPGLQNVEYPIDTQHWRIMILIGICYECYEMKEYLKFRSYFKKLVELLQKLKRSRDADSRKYHTAFSYIAYALLTKEEEDEELEVEETDQQPVEVDIKKASPTNGVKVESGEADIEKASHTNGVKVESVKADIEMASLPAEPTKTPSATPQVEVAEKVEEPVPCCSSSLNVDRRIQPPPIPPRRRLPTEPEDCNIPREILLVIYEYAALFYKRYGLKGLRRAERYLTTVIESSSRETQKSWWFYEKAKILARKRESRPTWYWPTPTEEEFLLVAKAIEIDQNPLYELYFADLLGQMGTGEYFEASLADYMVLGDVYTNTDLLCKCAEGILDLMRARDGGPQLDSIREVLGQKDMSVEILCAAEHVLEKAERLNPNNDVVNRTFGHLHLLKGNKMTAIKYLRKCLTYTYDSAFELIRLEKNDQFSELLYLFVHNHRQAIVESFLAREIISRSLFTLNYLKDAAKYAIAALDPVHKMIDVKTVYIPRLLYLRTRHGINWVDVIEQKIREDSLQEKKTYKIFLRMLRQQRQSIYREDGPEGDFIDLDEYVSFAPLTDKINNARPDVTGSTYISRKVGVLPVMYCPEMEKSSSFLPKLPSVQQVVENLLRGKKAIVEMARMMITFCQKPRNEILARMSNRIHPIDPRVFNFLYEDDTVPEGETQPERLFEVPQQPERPQELSFLPAEGKYKMKGPYLITFWTDSKELIEEACSIKSYESSSEDDEGRQTPSPTKPGTARDVFGKPKLMIPKIKITKPEESDTEMSSEDVTSQRKPPLTRQSSVSSDSETSLVQSSQVRDVFEKPKMVIPKIKISKAEESDTEMSSEDVTGQRKRPLIRQSSTSSDSDSSSIQSSKVVSTEGITDEEVAEAGEEDLPPYKRYKMAHKLRSANAAKIEQLLKQRQVGGSVPATPEQDDTPAFLHVQQPGTSVEGKQTPVAETAEVVEKLSEMTTSVEKSDVQTASNGGAEIRAGSERQTLTTDTKSSQEVMEVQDVNGGTSTEKKDDPDNKT